METENWLKKEAETFANDFDGERLPALSLEENKVSTISIDVSKAFDKWEDHENNTVKKILPCMLDGVQYVWWLNVKNPIYSKIVTSAALTYPEPLVIKVLQTGTKQNTRYTIVE